MAQKMTSGRAPSLTSAMRDRLLQDVLKSISRSFYLSLRILPRRLRKPVGLAYFLARVADTISDQRRSVQRRQEALDDLRFFQSQVNGPHDSQSLLDLVFRSLPDSSSNERAMFDSLVDAFVVLDTLDRTDQEQVRWVVSTLTKGMEMDLIAFPAEGSVALPALASGSDLDRYTYLVAGCVGEFWTMVSVLHEDNLKGWDVEKMSGIGVRFGKALQLTNILRDLPRDLRNGRCYLPADELAVVGLSPEDLLNPINESRAKTALIPWLEIALEHFQAAEEYLTAIPRRSVRLRLACLWPLLLGLATLARLARGEKWLDPGSTVKVNRGWVYRMMLMSLPAVFSNHILRFWIERLRRDVDRLT